MNIHPKTMTDIGDRAYRLLRSETNRILLSVAVAYVLGVSSLLSFSLTAGSGTTRLQFALLAVAIGLLFYTLIRAEEAP
jgi:hypothetical protein